MMEKLLRPFFDEFLRSEGIDNSSISWNLELDGTRHVGSCGSDAVSLGEKLCRGIGDAWDCVDGVPFILDAKVRLNDSYRKLVDLLTYSLCRAALLVCLETQYFISILMIVVYGRKKLGNPTSSNRHVRLISIYD